MKYKIRNLGGIFIYLLFFFTTCSVSSCATGPYKAYSGEELPSSKVAKIRFTVYRSHPLFGALESAGIQQIDNTIVFVVDDPSTEI